MQRQPLQRQPHDLAPDSLVGAFGAELRARRMEVGLSMTKLGEALGCSSHWISQVEGRDKLPSEAFARGLDVHFETAGTFHRLWQAIRRAARHRLLLPGFPQYVALEGKAASIRSFEPQVVPGLLQTPGYARGVMSKEQTSAQLDELVASRMERQAILHRDRPPDLTFVLDEAVLHRTIGGAEVMREQLAQLADLITSPHVQVRVLPFSSVTHAGLDGKFVLLGFSDGTGIEYLEGPDFGQLIEDPDAVAKGEARFDRILDESLTRDDSHRVILKAMEGL